MEIRALCRELFTRYWGWLIAGLVLGVVFLALIAYTFSWSEIGEAMEWGRKWALYWLERVPVPLYVAMFIILPLVGAPMTLFYLTAIPVLGGPYGLYGIVGGWLCMSIGMSSAYWLSSGIMRPYIARWMRARGYTIPVVQRENEWKFTLLVRVSPLPYLIQNNTLGLSGCRFSTYTLISVPTQCVIALGFMLMGESFASGGFRLAIVGFFLFMTCFFGMGYLRRRLRRKDPQLQVGV